MDWSLLAKLRTPSSAVEIIERQRLLNLINSELKSQTRLCLFTAPAGFGKTTSIVQFLESLPDSKNLTAWLRLDVTDSFPKRFLSNLILSMVEAGMDMSELELAAKQGALDAPVQTITTAILTHVERSLRTGGHLYAVLDDYHLAENSELDECVELLLQANIPNFCLIISSRVKISLKLSNLRLSGQILEIGEEFLRFDESELLSLFGDSIDARQQSLLFEKTQGWVAVLQLAKIWGQPDLLQHFNGGTESLADYITEQVIADLSLDEQGFLLDTAGLDQVQPEVANYIRGSNDSHYYCRSLLRLAPLVNSQHQDGWISYHPLLRDFLQQSLQHKDRQRWLQNNHRAAQWFDLSNDILNAIRFYCLAANYQQAHDCFKKYGGWQILTVFGHQLVSQILSFFPDYWIDKNPDLALFQVYLTIKQGQLPQARSLFNRAVIKQSLNLDEVKQLEIVSDIGLTSLILSLYEDAEINADTLLSIQQAQVELSPKDIDVRAILLSSEFICQYYLGKVDKASLTAKTAIQIMQDYELPYAQDFFYYHLGLSNFWGAEFEESQANIEQGIQFAAENLGMLSNLTAAGQVLLAQNYYYRDDIPSAETLLTQALATVSQGDGWFEILAPAYSVAIRSAYYGDRAADKLLAAEKVWREGVAVARERDLPRLEDSLDYVYIELMCIAGDLTGAQEALGQKTLVNYRTAFYWSSYYQYCLCVCRYNFMRGDLGRAQSVLSQWLEYKDQHQLEGIALCTLQIQLWQSCLDFQQDSSFASQQSVSENLNLVLLKQLTGFNVRFIQDMGQACKPLLQSCLQSAKKSLLSSRYCQLLKHSISAMEPDRAAGGEFSERELEVLQSLAQGNANKVIARQLDMTENTVKFHLKRIYKKLGVENRTAAVKEAVSLNML